MTGNRRFRGVDNKPGWINRALRDQRGDALRERAAKRLGSSSIGPGGTLTVQEGAQIIFQGTAPVAFYVDTVTATGPGNLVVPLTFEPIPGSEDVKWSGLGQPGQWTRDGAMLTLSDAGSMLRAGDVISVEYAYRSGQSAVVHPQPPGVLIDWGSTGPNLAVAEGSMTDYSQPGFDDSSWAVGAAAVGFPTGMHPSLGVDWEPVVTSTGTEDSGVWMRRSFDADGPADLSISIRVDGAYWLYVDGVAVASDPAHTGQAALGPFTHSVSTGSHVVALHVDDDASDPVADNLYADLFVEAV